MFEWGSGNRNNTNDNGATCYVNTSSMSANNSRNNGNNNDANT